MLVLLVALFAAAVDGHACGATIKEADLAFASILFHDGEPGVLVRDWVASADTGDIRVRDGVVEMGYSEGHMSALSYLGPSNTLTGAASDERTSATAFYSMRTQPNNCPVSSGADCTTEFVDLSSGVIEWKPLPDAQYAPLTTLTADTKRLRPNSGDVYLVRLGSESQDRIYAKVMFVEVLYNGLAPNSTEPAISSITFRWANLYNRIGPAFCDVSASMPSLLTNVAWSNVFGPAALSGYDDNWVAVLFLLFLFAMIAVFLMVAALGYWVKGVAKVQRRVVDQVFTNQPPAPAAQAPAPEGGQPQEEQPQDFL